jgi:hypothetical protein
MSVRPLGEVKYRVGGRPGRPKTLETPGGIHVFAGASAIGPARVANLTALAIGRDPNKFRTANFGSELGGGPESSDPNFGGPESSDPNFPLSEAAVFELVGPGKYGSYLFGPPRNSDPKFPRPGKFASELFWGKQIRILIFWENKGGNFPLSPAVFKHSREPAFKDPTFLACWSWIRISRGPES